MPPTSFGRAAAVAAGVALALALAPRAPAATIRPDTTSDELDATPDRHCSLREAVSSANADAPIGGCRAGSGADLILLRGRTYGRSLGGNDDANQLGDLDLAGDLTIRAPRERGAIIQGTSGPEGDRVLEVAPGARVSIVRVMVRNGSSPGDGGGILNRGVLTLADSTVYGSRAAGSGGGISTAGPGLGLVDVTLSHNRAEAGGGISVSGGKANLASVTVTGNAAGDGGGVAVAAGSALAATSIIAGNRDTDCSGKVASLGHDLIGTGAGCDLLGAVGDRLGVAARLGRLADNGGPTLTHRLRAGSAAINHGGRCPGNDQRGAPRRLGGRCDIGAYERIRCGGALVDFVGTPGRDSILGSVKRDGILGLGGADFLRGFSGDDGVCGGAGRDLVRGGAGDDRLSGGRGTDRLGGGQGRDRCRGGPGRDRIKGC